MKLVVEEAGLCRGGSRKDKELLQESAFRGCWRTKAQEGEGQMA